MKTLFYEKLDNQKVKCRICHHYCVIDAGSRGICSVRENQDGDLYSLVYSKIIARGIDPIEKKPIFHMKPGSLSYSIATVGCNFKCSFCQNSDIAQMPSDLGGLIEGNAASPESIVQEALKAGCESIAYTYTEPAVFVELALETAHLAKKKGLLNIFVTNGFMSPKVIEASAPVIDAANVDLKSFDDRFYRKYCKAKIEPVKETLKLMKSLGILVEVTTLLIPGLNDSVYEIRGLAEFIAQELGRETPWHVSRFYPRYKLTNCPSTPIDLLTQAYETGKKAGLHHVYIGNVPGLDAENTYCHSCGSLVIRRTGYRVHSFVSENGLCPDCGTAVYGIF